MTLETKSKLLLWMGWPVALANLILLLLDLRDHAYRLAGVSASALSIGVSSLLVLIHAARMYERSTVNKSEAAQRYRRASRMLKQSAANDNAASEKYRQMAQPLNEGERL